MAMKHAIVTMIMIAALMAPGCIPAMIGAAAGRGAANKRTTALMAAAGAIEDQGARMIGVTFGEDLVLAAVEPGSPADEDGFLPGDRITYVGNGPVKTMQQANVALFGPPGKKVYFEVERGGKLHHAHLERRCLPELDCFPPEPHKPEAHPWDPP